MKLSTDKRKASFREEREFGLLVGGALTLIGLWWLYRGSWRTLATGFIVVGGILIILGGLLPKTLVIPNRVWMGFARYLSMITTPLILGLVFYLVLMPIGVIKRLLGWDPLRRRAPAADSYWIDYNPRQRDRRHFEKMY